MNEHSSNDFNGPSGTSGTGGTSESNGSGHSHDVGATIERTAEWAYRGVWAVLTNLFHVPPHPPTLPALAGERVESLRPSRSWLNYMKLEYWITTGVMVLSGLAVCIITTIAAPLVGALVSIPVAVLIGVPAVLRFLAIHLRYDTTWYVLNSRSLRIRRGIWILHETTITFENVQDVGVSQGPLERWFGFATVVVKTAGGGGGHGHSGVDFGSHIGFLEGVENAAGVRDLILQHLKLSKHAGLGDELHTSDMPGDERLGGAAYDAARAGSAAAGLGTAGLGTAGIATAAVRAAGLGPAGRQTLREIRDAVKRLRAASERAS